MRGGLKQLKRNLLSAAGAALVATCTTIAAHAAEAKSALDIPVQSLEAALKEFGVETNSQVLFAKDIVAGRSSTQVKGVYTPSEALRVLLAGTGLRVEQSAEKVFLIKLTAAQPKAEGEAPAAPESPPSQKAATGDAPPASEDAEPQGQVEKVTVTGSRIRGAKQASPVVTITEDDMRRQGVTDLGQAMRAVPQNFSGGQNPGVSTQSTFGGLNNQNLTGSSGINLRGIGQDATLTLLNGTRLPYDGATQATDVAVVPIAAISRVEILLDGASAIYGSDAVGGVANIILKRDYDGLEVSGRWGTATEGGFEQQQYTLVAGTTWDTGGFIVTGDVNDSAEVTAGERDYLSYMPARTAIYPESKQKGVLFSGHQIFGPIEFNLDSFYTHRSGGQLSDFEVFIGSSVNVDRDSKVWGIVPSLRFDLPYEWSGRLGAAVGENKAKVNFSETTPTGTLLSATATCYCNTAVSYAIDFEGPLLTLPGGDIRLAIGGGYRENEFETLDLLTDLALTAGSDSSHFVYSELYIPVVSPEQAIPLIHKLALTGAVRYEDYKSFGETTTPKVGAIWSITSNVDLKATWGKSFKVPLLNQQFSEIQLSLYDAGDVGGTPGKGLFFIQGGNPNLGPEQAETLTGGVVVRPDFLDGFRVEANWFRIDYADRITQPWNNLLGVLTDPTRFEFVVFSPTVGQQNAAFALANLPIGSFSTTPSLPYVPADIVAIADGRYVNAASQLVKGIDVSFVYTTELFGGEFTTNGSATWLESTQFLTATSPEQTTSGVVFYPPEMRWRIGASWSDERLTLSANANQSAGIKNTLVAGLPKGSPFTTVDIVADYLIDQSPFGGQLQLTLGVQNLFNENPPFLEPLGPFFENYDATNYSPLGRVVNVTLTQRW